MTASVWRARALLAGLAVFVAASSFGVKHALDSENASSQRAVVATTTSTTSTSTTLAPTTTTAARTTTTTEASTATTAAAKRRVTTTTVVPAANLAPACVFASHIEAGAAHLASNATEDAMVITVGHPEWVGKFAGLKITAANGYAPLETFYSKPGMADASGLATFKIAINPDNDGQHFSVEVTGRRAATCGPARIQIDYEGPNGLPGGVAASGADGFRADG